MLFTEPDGSPLHPADVADEFARLIKLAGLPRIGSWLGRSYDGRCTRAALSCGVSEAGLGI